jgi:hypothetical protein
MLAQVFEAFFRDALKDGQSWFYLKLQTPIGVKPYKARFVIFTKGRHWSRRNTGSTAQRWSYGNVRYRLPGGAITRNGSLASHYWILR